METSGSSVLAPRGWDGYVAAWSIKALLRPAQMLAAAPSFLCLAALTAMLLRHPDVKFYEIDRIAFGLLVVGVVGRAMIMRQPLFVWERASWPMLGLTAWALASVAGQPFDSETWNLLASKLIVPFSMFHLAGLIFTHERRLRHFEIFCLVILAYLSFTAIAFLFGLHSLIFPRFILDASVGFQPDRARGPLLQAVANGVSLNILGLLAVNAYCRKKVHRRSIRLLLASVPIAILATMTRAVWLTFAGSVAALSFLSGKQHFRHSFVTVLVLATCGLGLVLGTGQLGDVLNDRLHDSGPVEFRQAVYAGSWEMFLQHPLTGWGVHQMPGELPRHVTGYRGEKILYPHNTYLELLAEQGLVGFSLYLWLMWELWKLGRGAVPSNEANGFLNQHFRRLWPIMLAVYWANAAVVVMSYQFVNALLFTLAGMLAAQRRRIRMEQSC